MENGPDLPYRLLEAPHALELALAGTLGALAVADHAEEGLVGLVARLPGGLGAAGELQYFEALMLVFERLGCSEGAYRFAHGGGRSSQKSQLHRTLNDLDGCDICLTVFSTKNIEVGPSPPSRDISSCKTCLTLNPQP